MSLCLLLLIFVLLKIPALTLPYFWDELGVYARAALYLHDNGPGLLPAALPPELSRGHPLLFSFLHAMSFRVFGDTVITAHILSLVFSICLLVTLFVISKKYFGENAALITVVCLMVQPVFFAQSVLVLPEITLALFSILAIWFWVEKKYFFYALTSVAAILTKETAIIIPFALLLMEVYYLFRNKKKIHINIKTGLLIFPLLVFGIFLLIQKQQNGWYLFPLHRDAIHAGTSSFTYFIDYMVFVFIHQGRLPATLMLLFFGYLVSSNKFCLCKGNKFLLTLLLLMTGGIAFHALNFYMDRYMLFIVVAMSMLTGYVVTEMIALKSYVKYLMAVVLLAPLVYLHAGEFNYDADMSYVDYVHLQQQSVDDVNHRLGKTDTLFANFPLVYAFFDTRLGYTDTLQITLTDKEHISNARYYLIAVPGADDHHLPPAEELKTLDIFENEVAAITLMQKIKP